MYLVLWRLFADDGQMIIDSVVIQLSAFFTINRYAKNGIIKKMIPINL